MRALIIRKFGDPKLLKVEEVPTPQPREREALVEVKAAGINPSDVKNAQGLMHGTTLPRIPGRDFAGVVVPGPGNLIGQEVWGTGGDIGYIKDGSHAQFILLPIAALTPKPANLSMDQAGSAPLVFVTAWSALVTVANVLKDEWVLIIGAAGGVGTAAVQVAKMRGARVIGAVRSSKDFPAAKENGADQVIDTSFGKLSETVHTMTAGRGTHVVFDTTGQMFDQSIEAAGMNARIPIITAPKDGTATFNLRNLYHKLIRVLGVDTRAMDVIACAKLLAEMRAGFESGKLKANPGQARTLDHAAEAYDLAGQGKGRFYLRPND